MRPAHLEIPNASIIINYPLSSFIVALSCMFMLCTYFCFVLQLRCHCHRHRHRHRLFIYILVYVKEFAGCACFLVTTAEKLQLRFFRALFLSLSHTHTRTYDPMKMFTLFVASFYYCWHTCYVVLFIPFQIRACVTLYVFPTRTKCSAPFVKQTRLHRAGVFFFISLFIFYLHFQFSHGNFSGHEHDSKPISIYILHHNLSTFDWFGV